MAEILWNFSGLKDEMRVILKQNPHFYAHLPMSPGEYTGGFTMEPTEDFRHVDKFYVLPDRQGLAYFKIDQHTQCFGNFWCPSDAIIFKGEHISYLFSFLFSIFLISCQTSAGDLWARISSGHPSKLNTGSFVHGHECLLPRS